MGNCCAIPERNSPNDETGDQKTRHRHRHQHNNRPKHRHRHRHRHHRNGLNSRRKQQKSYPSFGTDSSHMIDLTDSLIIVNENIDQNVELE